MKKYNNLKNSSKVLERSLRFSNADWNSVPYERCRLKNKKLDP